MKKVLNGFSVLLILCMTIFLLAGCGKESAPEIDVPQDEEPAETAEVPEEAQPSIDRVLLAVKVYDDNDELQSRTHYKYDDRGMLVQEMSSYAFDDFASEGILDYTYDDAGRLIEKRLHDHPDYTGEEVVVREYNETGSLITESYSGIIDLWTTKEYTYDESGRLIREVEKTREFDGSLGWEMVYSYTHREDSQGNTISIKHNETYPDLEDFEIIYNKNGQMIQGHDEYWDIPIKYTYIDDPYFCVRDEQETIEYGTGETEQFIWRYIYILDSAGKEIETIILGQAEYIQLVYDDEDYLTEVIDNTPSNYERIIFIYGAPDEEPEDFEEENKKTPDNPEPAYGLEANPEYHGYDEIISELSVILKELKSDNTSDETDYLLYESGKYSYLYHFDENCGYSFKDLDGNGVYELLVGESSGAEDYIYDLYTISGDTIVHLFSSGERDRLFLCDKNYLKEIGSGSAFTSVSVYYQLNGDELVLREAVIYDSVDWGSPDNPWYYSTTSAYDKTAAVSISEEEARQIENKYAEAKVEFTLFS